MKRASLLSRCLVLLLVLTPVPGRAGEQRVDGSILESADSGPGVGASVQVTYGGSSGSAGGGGGSSGGEGAAPAGSSAPAPVALSPHTCTPIYGSGGVDLTYSFGEAHSADCVSFLAPAPQDPEPDRPRRGRPAPPPPEEVARTLLARAVAYAPSPELEIAPAHVGLTGLASYVWLAREPQPITAQADAGPVTVTAQAGPLHYVWDFGDGKRAVTDHAGRPWTRSQPGNIPHTYETRGRYELAVEVIWEARWRVNEGPWQPLGYFSTTSDRSYSVRQVVALLARGR